MKILAHFLHAKNIPHNSVGHRNCSKGRNIGNGPEIKGMVLSAESPRVADDNIWEGYKIMGQRLWGERVTHQDVRRALRKFLDDGGIIVQLPEQKSEQSAVVGGEKYDEYESLTAILPS